MCHFVQPYGILQYNIIHNRLGPRRPMLDLSRLPSTNIHAIHTRSHTQKITDLLLMFGKQNNKMAE